MAAGIAAGNPQESNQVIADDAMDIVTLIIERLNEEYADEQEVEQIDDTTTEG